MAVMRLGILGGSFDPIHFGHLLVAEDVLVQLRLDRVLFVPTFRPPHKMATGAPYKDRVAMVRLALKGRPRFRLCPIEEKLPGPSYTVETLRWLRQRYPRATRYLLVGADQYRTMASWHRPWELTSLARIVVMSRPGVPKPRIYSGHSRTRVRFLDVIPVAISAREIRDRLASGRSVRYLIPSRVMEFIRRHRLYYPKAVPGRRLVAQTSQED
ncbi:MAG: nicotinate-nucleotide adenylyltransferase [candidate division WOR-3 bacterium]